MSNVRMSLPAPFSHVDAAPRGRFDLRFRSDALDGAFRAEVAAEIAGTWRVLFAVAVAATVIGGLPELFVLPADRRVIALALRYGFLVPMLAVGIVASRSRSFARLLSPTLVSAILSGFVSLSALGALYPDAIELPLFRGVTGVATAKFVFPQYFCLTVIAGCVSTGALRFRPSIVVTLGLGAAVTVFAIATRPPIDEIYYSTSLTAGGLVFSVFGAYRMEALRRQHFRQRRELEAERARSEALLYNTLPESIARRLGGGAIDAAGGAGSRPPAIADEHADVAVLFADLVGFTPLSAKLLPGALVSLLNELFSRFDEIAARHGVEKIKTIGDAYMVVSGAPEPRGDAACAVTEVALEMVAAASSFAGPDGRPLALRVGLHAGPAIAGVIGLKRFVYDLWGDTVNTASRMESHGVAGKIQVTEAVRERIEDRFVLERRGEIDVKGKGPVVTYYVVGRREAPRDG